MERLYCYVCDSLAPRDQFRRGLNDVCLSCRSSFAYTRLNAYLCFTRWCADCQERQPLTEFYERSGVLSNYCRHHERIRKAEEYQRNLERGITPRRVRWYRELRKRLSCSHCRAADRPVWLVHLRPSTKVFEIADEGGKMDVSELQHEIRKCEPLCIDCAKYLSNSKLYQLDMGRAAPMINWDQMFADVDNALDMQ